MASSDLTNIIQNHAFSSSLSIETFTQNKQIQFLQFDHQEGVMHHQGS